MGLKKGTKMSEEHKRKIQKALTGKPKSKTHKRAISEAIKDHWELRRKQHDISLRNVMEAIKD